MIADAARAGDGASSEGTFHEAANVAALYKLPVVFVCENNLYGEFTRQSDHQAIEDVADRASAYNMPGVTVDGMDVMAVYEAASAAVERARSGRGPTLLECKTYRFYDHVGRDFGIVKRDEEEVAYWRARDPIPQFRDQLIRQGVLGDADADADAIHERVRSRIEEAIKFAEESPDPDPSSILEDVFTEVTS